jgi:Tfp pilus assembly protein PilN
LRTLKISNMATAQAQPLTFDVDFLPKEYRQAGRQRKSTTLRVAVGVAFLAVILAAAVYQQSLRRLSDRQLAGLMPQYQRAQQQMQHLTEIQKLLQSEEKQAELWTYLRHPWPRSQLLAAVTEPLPDAIRLEQIAVAREPLPVSEHHPAATAKPGETELAKLSPTQRDLIVLRDQWDRTQIVVICTGVTDDTLALHQYLEQLSRDKLLVKVDVASMERLNGDAEGRVRFTARCVVRAGYAQPNGPQPSTNNISAATTTAYKP